MNYTKIALDFLKNKKVKKQPFFLLLHYWGVHMPYDPPPMYLENLNLSNYPNDPQLNQILREIKGVWKSRLERLTDNIDSTNELLARYDACIKFVDNEIGKIVKVLDEENLYNNSIIVITSDHGESLTEHGIYFDHHGLYDTTIRVPLIIRLPQVTHTKVNALTQHIDIVPTLLDYLGIEHDQNYDGVSLLSTIKKDEEVRDYIYTEEFHTSCKQSIRTKKYKLIKAESKSDAICKYCGVLHGDINELYDLQNDPKEEYNIFNEKPELAKELNNLLRICQRRIKEKDKVNRIVDKLKLDGNL